MVFRSRIDAWLMAVLVVTTLLVAGLAAWALGSAPPKAGMIVAGVALGGQALILWLAFSVRYTVAEGQLRVHAGPLRTAIPLASIESVRPSRNAASAPALSLQRLEIRYGGGRVLLVSPRDRARFAAALGHPLS